MKLEWEIIEETLNYTTQRLKIFGGWIVERVITLGLSAPRIKYHHFVEDPDHLWGMPEKTIAEDAGLTTCPNPDCKEQAYVGIGERGGKCLACKMRWCKTCGSNLTTEDLGEKCLQCGTFNRI